MKISIYDYALSFFGLPYIWGGDGNPGFDCSGLVQRILSYANLDPKGDQTAQALFNHFIENSYRTRGFGSLAFFGKENSVHHVGFCLDERVMISASGGGRECLTVDDAKRLNASVKIEPINWRKDFITAVMPLYQ